MGIYLVILRLVAGGACAVTFYRAGQLEEGRHGLLWASLSLLIYAICLFWLGGGWPILIGGQAALFVGVGLVRGIRHLRSLPPSSKR